MQLRFVRAAAAAPDTIPRVMRAFLGPTGLGHPHQPLATRACYLLMRVIKALRPSLKPYLPELIEGLAPRAQAVAASPVQQSAGALKGTRGRGALGALPCGPLSAGMLQGVWACNGMQDCSAFAAPRCDPHLLCFARHKVQRVMQPCEAVVCIELPHEVLTCRRAEGASLAVRSAQMHCPAHVCAHVLRCVLDSACACRRARRHAAS